MDTVPWECRSINRSFVSQFVSGPDLPNLGQQQRDYVIETLGVITDHSLDFQVGEIGIGSIYLP